LLRLEELVRRFLISRETLSVRMLDDSQDPTPLLKEIRDDKVATIIIDANASTSYHILRKARELGMTSSFYKYILTTMDFPWLHLGDVVDDQSNIVGFSMLNSSHPFYLEFHRSLTLSWREGCFHQHLPRPRALVRVAPVRCRARGGGRVQELNRSQDIGVRSPQLHLRPSSAARHQPHELPAAWPENNYTTLKILEKHPEGTKRSGGVVLQQHPGRNSTSLDLNASEFSLVNKTLVVTTILKPYDAQEGSQGLRGNEQYEGFLRDMLRELPTSCASLPDQAGGRRPVRGPGAQRSWTGMVGELIQ
ncbi:unnamed protein product, partial [Lota lota]